MGAGTSTAQEMLKPGDLISGQLQLVNTHHPNGTPITAYQIVADMPKKFAQKDDFCDDNRLPKTFYLVVIVDKTKWAKLKSLLS